MSKHMQLFPGHHGEGSEYSYASPARSILLGFAGPRESRRCEVQEDKDLQLKGTWSCCRPCRGLA